MNKLVHMFLAKASAQNGNEADYPKGERHSMIVFLSQELISNHDWEKAESIIHEAYWDDIEFVKAGVIGPENVDGKDQVFSECYEEALSNGSAMLVYTGVEK